MKPEFLSVIEESKGSNWISVYEEPIQ